MISAASCASFSAGRMTSTTSASKFIGLPSSFEEMNPCNRASPGFKKESLVFRAIALESTLPPHSDGAARRVSERITWSSKSRRQLPTQRSAFPLGSAPRFPFFDWDGKYGFKVPVAIQCLKITRFDRRLRAVFRKNLVTLDFHLFGRFSCRQLRCRKKEVRRQCYISSEDKNLTGLETHCRR